MQGGELVRTKTAHFLSEGQREAYEVAGIEKYRYLAALSERTCEICASLDNKVFPLDEATEGVNYPPMHPNCRCVTITADAKLSTRLARDPETGKNYKVDGNMDFAEWKESLTDEQKAVINKYVDNSDKHGIIKSGVFLTEEDPMREVFGSAFKSNKNEVEEMLRELKGKGVEVVFRGGVMVYQPNPISGKPGQIIIDKEASYSAFRHEEKHALDDEASGWLGFRNFMDKDTAIKFEVDAYDVEISLARQHKLPEMVDRLESLKEKRRRELLGE